jgi:DNA-binding response OmpR family regulator
LKQRILIVDDELSILKVLRQTLEAENFILEEAMNGQEALVKWESFNPDLIILDLMLPGLTGYQVCGAIRAQSQVPIIMLSAKGDLIDKQVGYNLGIDDYVTKPFIPSELVLKIKAILRRTYNSTATEVSCQGEIEKLAFNNLEINLKTREVISNKSLIDLTAKEFDLLWLMMSKPNQVFTREQLLNHIWQSNYLGDLNSVTVLIRRLREKIEENPAKPMLVRTVWGVGYKGTPPQ